MELINLFNKHSSLLRFLIKNKCKKNFHRKILKKSHQKKKLIITNKNTSRGNLLNVDS